MTRDSCDRGAFLRGSAAVLSALLLPKAAPSARARSADAPFDTREIAPGVHVHRARHALYAPENGGDIANCGFVVGRDAVAVIDTSGTALMGERLKAAVRSVTSLPVRYVVNTHMHPDHTLGNAAFAAHGTAFVAHHKMARGLAARAERYLAVNGARVGSDAFAGTRVVLPTITVESTLALDLGGRSLKLTALRTAHTDNDLTVLDTTTGTLFMGDLLFSGHVPTLDGSIRGWLSVLDTLAGSKVARVVPGHGPEAMDWPAAAEPIVRYLGTVRDGVRQAIKAGLTLAEAAASVGLSERDAWVLFEEYHPRNVSAAYAELEWE